MPKPKGNWFDSLFLTPDKKSGRTRLALELGRAKGRGCPYCGDSMQRPTRDHVMPKSKGYGFADNNKLLCCYDCNQAKANKTLVQWLIALAKKTDPKNVERARRVNELIQQRHRAGLKIDHYDEESATTA